eukprot:scaffold48_cov311-Pinguiococcus_pyrenoidosus.AAC.50
MLRLLCGAKSTGYPARSPAERSDSLILSPSSSTTSAASSSEDSFHGLRQAGLRWVPTGQVGRSLQSRIETLMTP